MMIKVYSKNGKFLGKVRRPGGTPELSVAESVMHTLRMNDFTEVEYKNEREFIRSSEIVRFKICEQ